MEQKSVLKYNILGCIVISIIGTFLHFSYGIFGNNIIFAPFSAINESVWEHVKIAIMPMFFWTIFEFCELMYRPKNLWTSLFIKIITIMTIIIVAYYCYTEILGMSVLVIDLFIFYIAIFTSQLLGYKVANSGVVSNSKEEVYKYIVIFIFLLFILFTFLPPKLDIFKDQIKETYGVFEFK